MPGLALVDVVSFVVLKILRSAVIPTAAAEAVFHWVLQTFPSAFLI